MDESFNIKETINAADLNALLKELFLHEVKSGEGIPFDPTLASDLMLNWLLNVHDG